MLILMFLIIIFLFSTNHSQAKPIKVEQILSHKKELQMDLNLSYSSTNKSSGKSQLIYLQTNNNSLIPVFTYLLGLSTTRWWNESKVPAAAYGSQSGGTHRHTHKTPTLTIESIPEGKNSATKTTETTVSI